MIIQKPLKAVNEHTVQTLNMVIWYKLQLHISYKKLWSRIFSCFYNVENKKLDIRSTWYKRQQLTVPSRPLNRVCTVVTVLSWGLSDKIIKGFYVSMYEWCIALVSTVRVTVPRTTTNNHFDHPLISEACAIWNKPFQLYL